LKRPPDRKFVLAVAIVVVAMGAMLSRPTAGLADHSGNEMIFKKVSGQGGR